MRLMSFLNNQTKSLGLRVGDLVIDLAHAAPELPTELTALLGAGPSALAKVAAIGRDTYFKGIPIDQVKLLPPTTKAGKILCLGINYLDHATESGFSKPDFPVLFTRVSTSLIASNDPLVRPRQSEQLDFEGELVVFIGARCRNVPESEALSHVAGYSIFNDASIRNYQFLTPQWTIGKNFDGTGSFGPEFVSADELPAGARGLNIQTRLNGKIVQNANTDEMVFGVAQTIALISECMTLEPGDLLVMGTPSGIGLARKPPLWMKPGDICEVTVEGIGTLRNPVEQGY